MRSASGRWRWTQGREEEGCTGDTPRRGACAARPRRGPHSAQGEPPPPAPRLPASEEAGLSPTVPLAVTPPAEPRHARRSRVAHTPCTAHTHVHTCTRMLTHRRTRTRTRAHTHTHTHRRGPKATPAAAPGPRVPPPSPLPRFCTPSERAALGIKSPLSFTPTGQRDPRAGRKKPPWVSPNPPGGRAQAVLTRRPAR